MFAHRPLNTHQDADLTETVASPARPADSISTISQLIESMREASTAYLVRFAPMRVPALRPTQVIQDALERTLLEPSEVSLLEFDALTIAVIVTPRSGQPLDPLLIHTLKDRFFRELLTSCGITDPAELPGDAPQITPLSYVSPVGALQENLAALNELLETIIHRRLWAQFQPIINLALGEVYGYEALIRVPQGGNLTRPGQFFRAADHARLVSWIDIAFQEKCFEEARRAGVKGFLFFNMDAEGLAHLHLAEHSLADIAQAYSISPSRIVLEVTERQAVEDFPRLALYLEQLRQQGFKLAIDDAGAGYNSLQAIADLRPDFVKIERAFVRSIENNGSRRALLATITRFARHIGAAVIAEGIETPDELATVIDLGVHFGQGYLLAKPQDSFRGLRRSMREFIAALNQRCRQRNSGRSFPIGSMARAGFVVTPDTPAEQIAQKFVKNPEMESIPVVQENIIVGLVMREPFEHALALNPDAIQEPISALMDRKPLVVEASTPMEDVAYSVTYRRTMCFHHDILIARNGVYVGIVPVRALLEAMTTLTFARLGRQETASPTAK